MKRVRIHSETYGTDILVCTDKESYLEAIKERGTPVFTSREIRIAEGATIPQIRWAILTKIAYPGSFITDFKKGEWIKYVPKS